jgi:hypothetical protein
MRGVSRRMRRARRVMSSRLPMGVETIYKVGIFSPLVGRRSILRGVVFLQTTIPFIPFLFGKGKEK